MKRVHIPDQHKNAMQKYINLSLSNNQADRIKVPGLLTKILSETDRAKHPEFYATLLFEFASFILDNQNQTEQLEQALTYLTTAKQIRSSEGLSEEIALIHLQLGRICLKLSARQGEEKLYDAIQYLSEAERYYRNATSDRSKRELGRIYTFMGDAYSQIHSGSRIENLEKARDSYISARLLITSSSDKGGFINISNNLANTYLELSQIANKKEINVKSAIEVYEQISEFISISDDALIYATLQSNLGAAYTELALMDSTADKQKSIIALTNALLVFNISQNPLQYAATKLNLGRIYRTSNELDAVDSAIRIFEEVESIFKRDRYPEDYALTQINLGLAYVRYAELSDNKGLYLNNAIKAYKNALEIYNNLSYPYQNIVINDMLGSIYLDIAKLGDKSVLGAAFSHYIAALDNFKLQPEQFANALLLDVFAGLDQVTLLGFASLIRLQNNGISEELIQEISQKMRALHNLALTSEAVRGIQDLTTQLFSFLLDNFHLARMIFSVKEDTKDIQNLMETIKRVSITMDTTDVTNVAARYTAMLLQLTERIKEILLLLGSQPENGSF